VIPPRPNTERPGTHAMAGLEGRSAQEEVIWHDVECGAYGDDLPLWEELAAAADGPVIDLGAGTGRVALHLARRGHTVVAVDVVEELVSELERRAAAEGLAITAVHADVRDLDLPTTAELALAPMQLYQLLGDAEERITALKAMGGALSPGGLAALAIVEGETGVVGAADAEVVPDVREDGGWLYSSLPLEVVASDGSLEVKRLRQTVSPDGRLTDELHTDRLHVLDADTVEGEGQIAGFVSAGRHEVPPSDLHVGSTVVLLRKEA
jgi:SAM-dependent methyltransferase